MKQIQQKTLGLRFLVSAPEDAAEFDKLAGRVGACNDEATSNVLYRSTYPGIRAELVERLEALTGEPRRSKEKKNSKGETVTKDGVPLTVPAETELDYYNRLLAGRYDVATRGPLDESEAQAVLDKLAADEPDLFVLDPSTSERTKKAPKEIELAADSLIARINADQTSWERVFNNLANALNTDVSNLGEYNRENLVSALLSVKEQEDRARSDRFA